jgi:broad specificity phosphatase PhoE
MRLVFLRHGEKAQTAEGQADQEVPLTQRGREEADARGEGLGLKPDRAIVYGSSRGRSLETAYRTLFGKDPDVSGAADLDSIRDVVSDHLRVGKKEKVDDRLNFNWEGSAAFKTAAEKAYKQDKRLVPWMVEESDALVEAEGDLSSVSYTRAAANIAELIVRYVDASDRLPANADLQRVFGSHNSILESFLAKVYEKTQGVEARDEFVQKLASPNGFDYLEGFEVRVLDNDPLGEYALLCGDEQLTLDRGVLEQILVDRQELDARIQSAV